jgi:hypothetical protein
VPKHVVVGTCEVYFMMCIVLYCNVLSDFVGLYIECSNCHIGLGMY